MAKKMSKNKKEFLDNLTIDIVDYRSNAEDYEERCKKLSSSYKSKRFRIKEIHMKEAIWLLRDVIKMDDITLRYIDGNSRRHITATLVIWRDDKFGGCIFLSNATHNTIISNGISKYRAKSDTLTVKEFFREIRKMRDIIKNI